MVGYGASKERAPVAVSRRSSEQGLRKPDRNPNTWVLYYAGTAFESHTTSVPAFFPAMRNPAKIQSDILKVLNTPDQGAKLSRLEDWLAARPDSEVAYALNFIRRTIAPGEPANASSSLFRN